VLRRDGALLNHRCSDAGHGVSAARACALRHDDDLGQGLLLARLASRRLHWRLAALTARNRRSAPLEYLENTVGHQAGCAACSLVMGSLHRLPAPSLALPTSFL
jgi:hypothetical protein